MSGRLGSCNLLIPSLGNIQDSRLLLLCLFFVPSWTQQQACPAGHGGGGCLPCAEGFFSDEGDPHCRPCPPGMTTLQGGSVSRAACGCPQVAGYRFFPEMDVEGNDLQQFGDYEVLSELARKCDALYKTHHCVAFTTLGVLKNNTSGMMRRPGIPCSGTYVQEDTCVVPQGTEFLPGVSLLSERVFDLGPWDIGEDLFKTLHWCYSHDQCMGFDTQGRVVGRIPNPLPKEDVLTGSCQGLYVLTEKCLSPPGFMFAQFLPRLRLTNTINKIPLDPPQAVLQCERNRECIAITTEGFLLSNTSQITPGGQGPSYGHFCHGFFVKIDRCPQADGFDFYQSLRVPQHLTTAWTDRAISSGFEQMVAGCRQRRHCTGFTTSGFYLRGSLLESSMKAQMRPCEGLYIMRGRCTVPHGYEFHPEQDAPGNDLLVIRKGEISVDNLAMACSMREDCKGFNTEGALKAYVLDRKHVRPQTSSCKGLYRRKGVCHPPLGYILKPQHNATGIEVSQVALVLGERKMREACDQHPQCIAFSTQGVLYSQIDEEFEDKVWFSQPCSGLYVRPVCEAGYGLPPCVNGVWTLSVGRDGPVGDDWGTGIVEEGWELRLSTVQGTQVFANPTPLHMNAIDPNKRQSDVVVTGIKWPVLDIKVKLLKVTTKSLFNISAYLHTPEQQRMPLFTEAHELVGHTDPFMGDLLVDDDVSDELPVELEDDGGGLLIRMPSVQRFLSTYKNKSCSVPSSGCHICEVGTWAAKGDNFCQPCEKLTITSIRGAMSAEACDRCFVPSGYTFHPNEDAVDPKANWQGYGPVDVRRLVNRCGLPSGDPLTSCAGFNTRMTLMSDVSTRRLNPLGFPNMCDGLYVKTECTQVEGYRFLYMYDSRGTRTGSPVPWPDVTVMAQVCGATPGCVAFNTHGWLMDSIADLSRSYLYEHCHGVYVKEGVCYEPPGYTFYPHEDIVGPDLDISGNARKIRGPQEPLPPRGFPTSFLVDLNMLAKSCNMVENCVAFNTEGQAKSDAGPRVLNTTRFPGACEGVYVANACVEVEGYTFVPGVSSRARPIGVLEDTDLSEVGDRCSRMYNTHDCVAFTSSGWLLNDVDDLDEDETVQMRCSGIYVRADLAGELLSEDD